MAEELGLVEFLADLRSDLRAAQIQARRQAAEQAAGGAVFWLGVEEVTVNLEVVHERTVSGEASAKVGGKFWVFASAEASVQAGTGSKQSGSQTLTLTLRPRLETPLTDQQGQVVTVTTGLDVGGQVAEGEQLPPPPAPQK